MIFDKLGLPKDTGASDWQDSSRLAGIMVLFEWPPNDKAILLGQYLEVETTAQGSNNSSSVVTRKYYVRHPNEYKYDFSRDQALCLMAGLWESGLSILVDRKFVNGKDIFTPSHMGHVARCQNKKPTLLQKAWLWIDVLYNAHFKNQLDTEANQLLCMMYVAYLQGEKSYLQHWMKHAKNWQEGLHAYWGTWRGERALAEHIIGKLQECLK